MAEPDSESSRQGESLTFLDLISALVKRGWFIVGFSGGVTLLVLAVMLVTKLLPPDSPRNAFPDYYRPVVKVLIGESGGGSSISAILGQSGLGSLSSLFGAGGSVGQNQANIAKVLLTESNTIADTIADEFGFKEKYAVTKTPRTKMRGTFRSALSVKYDEESSILTVGYKDIDPDFATHVLNRTVELLEAQFKSLTLEKTSLKKRYIEESIASVEASSVEANVKLADFQNTYGIFDISQASESIRQIASLQSQVISKQLELSLLRKSLPEIDARIVQKKNEIEQLQSFITAMKEGTGEYSLGIVSARKAPELSLQYLSLQSEAQIQQSMLSMLKQQYETVKLEELDTSQAFQVIAKAEIPEAKAGPGRARTIILAAFLSFFISILVSFVLEYFERASRDRVESAKLSAIKRMLLPWTFKRPR